VSYRLVVRTGHPDFLDLPWEKPLQKWKSERLVQVQRGIGRHIVRFVDYDGALYALKELPPRIAQLEYRLLRRLADTGLPAVEPVGVVGQREHSEESILITRYLEFSLPYRLVLQRKVLPAPLPFLLDAFAQLLVRLHLLGFFWGDCSLSNTLFRRDAGALSAYLVDAETGELHDQLSDGQRMHDIQVAEDNVVGEMYDLSEEIGEVAPESPFEVADDIRARYDRLWSELTQEETFGPDERYRLDERLHRLNDLGFDVEEIELSRDGNGYRLRVRSQVVEPGHHRRRLLALTGLRAQENQARRLLRDIDDFGKELEKDGAPAVSESALAGAWLYEVFEPSIAAIPKELFGKREPAELYHELLEHRWFLSEQTGVDVGRGEALRSYVERLRSQPDERRTIVGE
jgi:tRNA A-37 threonylcarbamoyl transferase component Bud32